MKLRLLLSILFSFFFSLAAYSQANVEVPTDRVLEDAEDLRSTAEGLSDDFREQLEDENVQSDLKNKVIEAAAGDFLELTDEEKNVLSRMGMSDSEIDSIDFVNDPSGSKDKLVGHINKYASDKQNEVKDTVMQDAVPGLGASILGLTFSTFLGPLVGIKCWSQTSAKVFAGTSVAWLGLEMMSWNNYKIKLEELSNLGNTAKVSQEARLLAVEIQSLYNQIKTKMNESKIDSIEEAGDIADENLVFIETKIGELREAVQRFQKEFMKFSDDQIGALGKLRDSIALIRDNTNKKVKNATIAAAGFVTSSGIAFAEQYNLIGSAGGKCVGAGGAAPSTSFNPLEFFIPSAHAGAKEVAASNFDKLGIPIGGGLLAAYLGFKMKFLNAIYASGTSRGITFGVMAGIAGVAAWKMKEFVKYLSEQISLIDDLISAFKKRITKTDDLISKGDRFLQFVEQIVLPQVREVVNQVDDLVDDLSDKVNDYKDQIEGQVEEVKGQIEEGKDQVDEIKSDLEGQANDLKDEVNDKLDEVQNSLPDPQSSLFNYLIGSLLDTAHAAKSRGGQCLYGFQNMQLDKHCICRKKNKCTNIKLGSIKGKKSDMTKKLIEKSHQITTGLKYLSNGMPSKADRYFSKVVSERKYMDQINDYFIKKINKKGFDKSYYAKMANQEIAKLEPIGREMAGKSYAPTRKLMRRTGFNKKARARNNMSNEALVKLKNIMLLKDFLDNKRGRPSHKRGKSDSLAEMSESDLIQGLNDIEEDKNKDIFKIISRRYFLIYQRQ